MNKEFIPYEQALELKELGFDEPCLAVFNQEEDLYICHSDSFESEDTFYSQQAIEEIGYKCLAPTFSQAFRWFREKHGLDSWVYRPNEKLNIWGYNTTLHINVSPFKSHEEAELACLKKLIEIVKQKS